MNGLILDDGHWAPQVFRWKGPVDRRAINEWIGLRGWTLPRDLLDFWTVTGGGEIFESERFLPPLGSAHGQEEIGQLNGGGQSVPDTGALTSQLRVDHRWSLACTGGDGDVDPREGRSRDDSGDSGASASVLPDASIMPAGPSCELPAVA